MSHIAEPQRSDILRFMLAGLGDVVGCLLDRTANKVSYSKNGELRVTHARFSASGSRAVLPEPAAAARTMPDLPFQHCRRLSHPYFPAAGQDLGVAYDIPGHLRKSALYPCLCLKNAGAHCCARARTCSTGCTMQQLCMTEPDNL